MASTPTPTPGRPLGYRPGPGTLNVDRTARTVRTALLAQPPTGTVHYEARIVEF